MRKHQRKPRRKSRMKLVLICGALGVLVISTVISGSTTHKTTTPETNELPAVQQTPSFSQTTISTPDVIDDTSEKTDVIPNNPHAGLYIEGKDDSVSIELPVSPKDPATSKTPTVHTADWNLLLVNPWNKVPSDFSVELTQLKNGHAIDKRAYPDLQDMMDAMRAEGLSPLICSSYRTNEKQQTLYNNQVSKYLARGYSQSEAEAEAGKWVAVPGTSEHQTGLAVDIVDMNYQLLDEKQEDTAVQKWLIKNSYKYGFILRYPSDKSEITGINYEPWHYRYVGKDVAKEVYEQGVCFEEYLSDGL